MIFRGAPHPMTKNISKHNKTNNLAETRPRERLGFFNLDLLSRLQLWDHWGMLEKLVDRESVSRPHDEKKGVYGDITTK